MKRTCLVFVITVVVLMSSIVAWAQNGDKTVVVTPEGIRVEGNQKPSLAAGVYTNNSQVFVSTRQPIFLHGQKLAPNDGGYQVSISKASGIRIDGRLYLPMIKPVIDKPAKIEDGFFHYVVDKALRIRIEAYEEGQSGEQVRERLLAFWTQYSDSLEVVPAGRGFFLTYQGNTLTVSSLRPSPIRTAQQQTDDYFNNCLLPAFKTLLMYLEAGHLVICGQNYMNAIDPADADEALMVINQLADRVQVSARFDGQTEYYPLELSGGKYLLTTSVIEDLLLQK